jgi:hypothetical protein
MRGIAVSKGSVNESVRPVRVCENLGIPPLAQVTMSKLIRDYRDLGALLRELGFCAVAFSYPQRSRLGSSSLAWSDNSQLMNFTTPELISAFDSVLINCGANFRSTIHARQLRT